jgi:hypothetical protein
VKQTARAKLEQSRLRLDQLNGFGDIDVKDLRLKFKKIGIPLHARITSAPLERTIEGASTISLSLLDDDLSLLRSGNLRKGAEIEIDGLFFRICAVKKQGKIITVVFEEREINLLRLAKYSKPKIALRENMTRAEFVLTLLRQVTEVKIRYYIPELHKAQPVEAQQNAGGGGGGGAAEKVYGFGPMPGMKWSHHHQQYVGNALTIKHVPATKSQLRNADAILQEGVNLGARRKVLVASIMTAIQESTMQNLPDGSGTSVGLFQQTTGWGSFRDRHDPTTAARLFFNGTKTGNKGAIQVDQEQFNLDYGELCQAVQHSAHPTLYAQWRKEAEIIVTAWGIPGGDTAGSMADANSSRGVLTQGDSYHYYRGIPPKKGQTKWKPESSWDCITRLAKQVNWRAFEVSGVIYFIDDEDLIKSKPIMNITEETPGIDSIDFDYDENKPTSQITTTAEIKRWAAPPGSVVMVDDMGPATGRWLVTDISRDLFSTQAEITLKKPLPALPEPAQDDLNQQAGLGGKHSDGDGQTFKVGTALVKPIPKPYFTHQGGQHVTQGLAGYMAIDFFARPGSPVIAPESGRIVRFSGHDPSEGPPLGVGGPLGWSIYLLGDSGTEYYMTHLGTRAVRVGQKVAEAQTIATVADYDKYGGKGFSHCHCGVHPGRYTITDLGNAPAAVPS